MKKILTSILLFFLLGLGILIFYRMSPFEKCTLVHGGAYTEETWGRLRFNLPACWTYGTNSHGGLYLGPKDDNLPIYESPDLVVTEELPKSGKAPDRMLTINGKEFSEYSRSLYSYYVPTYFENSISIFISHPYDEMVGRYSGLATIFGSFEEVSTETTPAPFDSDLSVTQNYSENVDFSRETSAAYSASTLAPDTGRGLTYDAGNVFDKDNSTAWCRGDFNPEDDGPFAGTLMLTFTEPVGGKTLGLMPGFAGNEDIFGKNNRIKTLSISGGSSPLLSDATIFQLQDEYRMQYIKLPEDAGTSINLSVLDVFPGSVYDDTCISEIDLWDTPAIDAVSGR